MQITYLALIDKMEKELKQAKESHDLDQIRGHLFAVKALAELTLDSGSKVEEKQSQVLNINQVNEGDSRGVVLSNPEPKENSEDGDSIFDF